MNPRWKAGLAVACVAAVAGLLTLIARSSEDKQVAVYAPQASFVVHVSDRENREYVDLLSVLEPIADAKLKVDGKTCRIRVGAIEGSFADGDDTAHVGQKQIHFPTKLILENGRVQVPIIGLPALLQELAHLRSELHAGGRRLFVENTQTRFSVELKKSGGAELVLSFPMRVNPTITQDGNRVHMTFKQEPVIYGVDNLGFNDPLITNMDFEEKNGTAEITVNASAPLMVTFADEGKTLSVKAAPATALTQTPASGAAIETPAAGAAQLSPTAATAQPTAPPSAVASNAVRYFVMIDPGHGGTDPGVKFSAKVNEKEITLALARRLRSELQNRGIAAVVLRDSDSTVSSDERAVATNGQRASIYVALHAGGLGTGVRVYAAQTTDSEPSEGPFVPWGRAQERYRERSVLLARVVANEITGKKIPARMFNTAVPPLNAIAAPAIAIEVGPPRPGVAADELVKASYQQAVVAATVNAIASARSKLEEMR